MNQKTLYRAIAIVLAAGSLAACGGGGGGDTGNTTPLSTTTVGTLTGFGSIYVNGVRFDTSRATYEVDGSEAFDDSALGVGMKVKVKGTKDPDGMTGTADSVYYDDDLDGPIADLTDIDTDTNTRSFTVFGQLVIVNAKRTVFDDVRFDTLANGQVVEISGYYEGKELIATRVELEDDDDDDQEVKGVIATIGVDGFELRLPSGTLVPVITNNETSYDVDTGLRDGLYVEVEGRWNGSALVAEEIDDADDLLDDDDDDVELKGPLTGDGESDGESGWSVKGIPVILTSATEYEPSRLRDNLLAGMMVEVEGYMQDGALIAEEIEGYEDDDIEIEAPVLSVSYDALNPKSGKVTLQLPPNGQTLEVITNSATLFKDDSDWDLYDDGSFSLDELASSGEFVEIEAYLAGEDLIATTISREDEISDTAVEGPVQAFEANEWITVLGITWTLGPETEYEVDDGDSNAETFWNTIRVGMEIEIEDEAPANGIADKLELDDGLDDDD